MRPFLNLDFSRSGERPGFIAYALLAAGVLAAAIAAHAYVETSEKRATLEDSITEMKALSGRRGVRLAEPAKLTDGLRAEIRRANRVIDQIAIPWNALFGELERAATPEVALLAVEPDAARRRVRIDGEAKSLAAVLSYMERLDSSRGITDIVLTGHALKDGGGHSPVAFSLVGRWTEEH